MTYLDDEVDRIKADPRATHRMIQDAESWRTTWKERWRADVVTLAGQRSAANRASRERLYDQMRDTQREADANRAAVEAGEIGTPEFLNRASRLTSRVDEYDRRLQGLVSSEALIAQMTGDPVGWQDSFYEKWTTLQRNRPSLYEWLHEAEESRRRRSRDHR